MAELISVILTAAVSCTQPPRCDLSASAQVAAGLWHLISMLCQLKANMPTCTPLCVGLLQIPAGLFIIIVSFKQRKYTGRMQVRGGTGSECLCRQSQSEGGHAVRKISLFVRVTFDWTGFD